MIKLKDILLEMAKTDIHYQNIMDQFNNGDEQKRNFIYQKATGRPYMLEKELSEMDIEDITELEQELGISPIEEKKEKPGLWANIRAQRARGEKPARKGSKEYKQAVKAAKEINKATKK